MPVRYIIADGNDVTFFDNKETAERYMEAADVADDVYRGYDAAGRLLRISPRGQASEISLAEEQPHHVEELKSLISRYLEAAGRNPVHYDLPSLLDMCSDLCYPYRPKQTNRSVGEFALPAVVFILSVGATIAIEVVAWKNDWLLALALPVLLYALAEFRILPWKTPFRKAFSLGICVGMVVLFIIWAFEIHI